MPFLNRDMVLLSRIETYYAQYHIDYLFEEIFKTNKCELLKLSCNKIKYVQNVQQLEMIFEKNLI